MTLEASNSVDHIVVPATILEKADARAKYSREYLAKINKSPEAFAQEMKASFGITIDSTSNEGLTRGVFELQKRLGMAEKQCDGLLGNNTYTILFDKLLSQDTSIEKSESIDALTGYKITTLTPKGFVGDLEVHFCGNNQSATDEIRNTNAQDLIHQRAQGGEFRAIAFVTGKNAAGKDKYEACARKGALTSMVRTAAGDTEIRALTLSAASRGGEAMAAILSSDDPMLAKVKATNSFDSTYYGAASFTKFAKNYPEAAINVAYIESGATAKTAEAVRSIPNAKVEMIARDRSQTYLAQHVAAPGQFMRSFEGLPAERTMQEQLAAKNTALEVPTMLASSANVMTLGMLAQLRKIDSGKNNA